MNIEFSQFRNLNAFLAAFAPQLQGVKPELNKSESEKLIGILVHILDALFKGENLQKQRNLILPEGRSFFTRNIVELMSNISLYLYKFDTRILTFSRTERQTFIFIIENIVDYFKSSNYYVGQKDTRNLFMDYRFWIENFFKILDQKLYGSIVPNKKVNFKSLFNSYDAARNQLVFTSAEDNFTLSPFMILKDNQYLFLTGVTEDDLIYKDLETETETTIDSAALNNGVFEFLTANFDFSRAGLMRHRIKADDNPWIDFFEPLKMANQYHKDRQFKESWQLLKEIPLERINMPLVFLLQIKNLVNMNRVFEVKQLMQKFVLLFPYYVDVYEIMGDIYQQEGNLELAVNFYEKVLVLAQNKRVAEKLKKVRDLVSKNKTKPAQQQQQNEYFYDITGAVFSDDEEFVPRDRDLRQMMEILLSNSRSNLMLVGESGVGKTALIKLLSQKLLDGDVPAALKGKRLKEINFVSLLTGSKYRGQFEEKALKLLSDFKTQNAILILEDIHLMMAGGNARGTSMDLVNIMKGFLREKSLKVIATTNYEEYKNTIEKDNSLMGFFQKLTVKEMSPADTRQILNNQAKKVFVKDKIMIPGEIIDDIVACARKDVREKKLPDAAVMLLERVIANVKLKTHFNDPTKCEVEQNDLVEVLADMLNLPESNVSVSLRKRLLNLKAAILDHIKGQDDSIERMVKTITTSKLDFNIKNNRPDGVFLFIGPTGVGKTETAIALSKCLYGSEDYLIRIDMSEYMEKFTYSRFVGAAPGYVGYSDTNQLTDKVRQNPYSIILLDEIEKADSQLLNIFLQVFDAGRLTDARGNTIDFSHAIIIMTSNIGTNLFSKSQMGYRGDLTGGNVSHSALIKVLKRYFSPEFLNRIDEIMIFDHLPNAEVRKIVETQLKTTYQRFEKENKELVIKDDVIDHIIELGYSKEYGARHIARTLKKEILEKVAHLSLEKEWEDARQVVCQMNGLNTDVEVRLIPAEMEPLDGPERLEEAEIQ